MSRPEPTYEFYSERHMGEMDEERFARALPLALAKAREMVAPDVPDDLADAYMHAVCALADRVGGQDRTGLVQSETVGSTSFTYTDAAAASGTDADAVRPWLAGTGLLYRGIR